MSALYEVRLLIESLFLCQDESLSTATTVLIAFQEGILSGSLQFPLPRPCEDPAQRDSDAEPRVKVGSFYDIKAGKALVIEGHGNFVCRGLDVMVISNVQEGATTKGQGGDEEPEGPPPRLLCSAGLPMTDIDHGGVDQEDLGVRRPCRGVEACDVHVLPLYTPTGRAAGSIKAAVVVTKVDEVMALHLQTHTHSLSHTHTSTHTPPRVPVDLSPQ